MSELPGSSSGSIAGAESRALSRVLSSGNEDPLRSESAGDAGLDAVQRELLLLAYNHGALKFGEFSLKSGRKSPFFFNAGMFGNGQAMESISKAYATRIVQSGIQYDVLFGPAYKVGIFCSALCFVHVIQPHPKHARARQSCSFLPLSFMSDSKRPRAFTPFVLNDHLVFIRSANCRRHSTLHRRHFSSVRQAKDRSAACLQRFLQAC